MTTSTTTISKLTTSIVDNTLEDYAKLATRNEDLKSEERVLNSAKENLKQITNLLLDKEKEFCVEDQSLRASAGGRISVKDSLRKRCSNLINHLVHYKCVIECLSSDVLAVESNLLSMDEYISLCLILRETALAILDAIKENQKRNEILLNMHDEEAQSCLTLLEPKWRSEHQARRKLLNRLILDHNQVVDDKMRQNLEQQQILLNQRYQSINNLIKMSYNHLDDNNNNNTINKNQA